jgi:hypothetical protein
MTKSDSNQPVTRGMLDEAVQATLEGMDRIVERFRNEVNTRFENVDNRFDNLEAKIDLTRKEFKDEVDGLKADLSDAPSRREFEGLKARVDKYHPLP